MFSISDVRPGDIFRVSRSRGFMYGIVIAGVKKLKAQCNPRSGHSLLAHTDDSFIYRLCMIGDDAPDLAPDRLVTCPLGPAVICGQVFEEEQFTVIGQTAITEDLLAFPVLAREVSFVAPHAQVAFMDALGPEDPYWDNLLGIALEWGTACVQLANTEISPELRHQVKHNCLCSYHSTLGIHSGYAQKNRYNDRGTLTLPEEVETIRALFSCFGLAPDAGFDDFARRWGGLTKAQLVDLLTREDNE